MNKGTSNGGMISEGGWQTFTSEFESHRVLHSFGLGPHLNK